MDLLFLTMRMLHIVLGVFWAGTMIFAAVFLLPSIREAGPDGAKVVAGLIRRRFLTVMPLVAFLNILSGFWLYGKVSGGFEPAYLRSTAGMTFATGAAFAILAFLIGITIVRPATLRASALGQNAGSAAPSERDALMARIQALRARAGKAGMVVALLLALAAAAMAVARYG